VVAQVAPYIVVGLAVALAHSPALNVLSLGEDVARGLGQRVGLVRGVGLAATVTLTGAATAACGPIAFVGLAVPHLARGITGPDQRWVVPWSMVLGGLLVVGADVVGRVVVIPAELEVGVVTAFVGAPVFLAIARRRRVVEL
jgi:iron complex transport system permease protein